MMESGKFVCGGVVFFAYPGDSDDSESIGGGFVAVRAWEVPELVKTGILVV